MAARINGVQAALNGELERERRTLSRTSGGRSRLRCWRNATPAAARWPAPGRGLTGSEPVMRLRPRKARRKSSRGPGFPEMIESTAGAGHRPPEDEAEGDSHRRRWPREVSAAQRFGGAGEGCTWGSRYGPSRGARKPGPGRWGVGVLVAQRMAVRNKAGRPVPEQGSLGVNWSGPWHSSRIAEAGRFDEP